MHTSRLERRSLASAEGSPDFDFNFHCAETYARRDEQCERQRARRVRGLRRARVVVGIRAALGAPLRESGALCTAAQRVGRKPRKARRADRDSSSHDSNLENRHDRGQDHHCPVRFRARGTAGADHSGRAAKPRRRSRIAGSTSYLAFTASQPRSARYLVSRIVSVSVSVETRRSDDLYPGSSPDGDGVGAER